MTRMTPKMRFRPQAISAYRPPSSSPPINSSVNGIARGGLDHAGAGEAAQLVVADAEQALVDLVVVLAERGAERAHRARRVRQPRHQVRDRQLADALVAHAQDVAARGVLRV